MERRIKLIVEQQPIIKQTVLASSSGGGKPYTGAYEVIPKVDVQQLPTTNCTLKKDVTVFEIPKHEVSNEYGTTVVIGGIL